MFFFNWRKWFQRQSRSRAGSVSRPGRKPYTPRLEALEDRLTPAGSFVVLNTNGDMSAGSLWHAINDADNQGGGTITFASGVTGTIDLLQALPNLGNISSPITIDIEGPGADKLTVQRSTQAGSDFSIFTVTQNNTATIAGLTISKGTGTFIETSFGSASDGGGINNQGTLTLNRDFITGNTATDIGGGIINGSLFSSLTPSLTVSNSTISNNTNSNGQGAGGIDSEGGTVTIINSTISGNQAINSHSAGGIGIYAGTATIKNSTITNNLVSGDTSAIVNGGGIDALGTQVNLFDTIVAGNRSISGNPDVFGTFTSQGHNLVGDGTGASGFVASDKVGSSSSPINPLLGPLQDNGGPTPTHRLIPDSPALDAGDNSNAPATDQRGLARISNGTIDIGAVEMQRRANPNQAFVILLYRDVLHRNADQQGLIIWVGALDSGKLNRFQVADIFRNSPERRGLDVDQFYAALLGHGPDANGRTFWVGLIVVNGVSEGSVVVGILSSPEYLASHDNITFIQNIFQSVLGVPPTSAQLAALQQALATGAQTRAGVAALLLSGNEAYVVAIQEDYRNFLRRLADLSGAQVFLADMATGKITPVSLSDLLLASDEYFALAQRITAF